jgi:tRNA (mo5U34)-methyltransferase
MPARLLEGKSREELLDLARQYHWWHSIDLGGLVTNGVVGRWPLIAKAFDQIDFTGKKVLDVGCWDGLWSFEAEKRGAREVYSIDYVSLRSWSEQPTYQLAHRLLGSKARYYPNLSVYDIQRLGVTDFDVVVYCGIYYHLLEPLRAFAALREVMKEGGFMIVEGPVLDGSDKASANFYARTWFSEDPTNWWVPSMSCLREWLDCTCFDVVTEFSDKRNVSPPAAVPTAVTTRPVMHRLRGWLGAARRKAVVTQAAPVEAESQDRVSIIARATSTAERLARRVKRQALAPLPATPGMTPEAVAGFLDAASRFRETRPWRRVRHDRTIKLECASLGGNPAFITVLGNGSSDCGLVVYYQRPAPTLHLQGSLLGELLTWAPFAAVLLGKEGDLQPAEADAVFNDGHGYTRHPANTLRRPRVGELQLLEACLRALPGFIERHAAAGPAAEVVVVRVSGGEVGLTLSWVVEGEREL